MLSENVLDNYCIISGDLVYKGGNDYGYDEFHNGFISRLIKFVPISHILITPGNHDISQKYVTENLKEHQADINRKRTEVEFNEYVADTENCKLRKKFASFEKLSKEKLGIYDFDLPDFLSRISETLSLN